MNKTLVKKLDVVLDNNNLPVLEDYNVNSTLNATLVQDESYIGNSKIISTSFIGSTSLIFIFRVDSSIVLRYRMYNGTGYPLVSDDTYYEPNVTYTIKAEQIGTNFFNATRFGPLVNNPNPLQNGTGVFEIYAAVPENE